MPRASSSSVDPWMTPRVSFSKDFAPPSNGAKFTPSRASSAKGSPSEFEFAMSIQGQGSSYSNTMLPADELFHEGKLLPLYTPHNVPSEPSCRALVAAQPRKKSNAEEPVVQTRIAFEHPSSNNAISPKAPTCTSRWKELLGLKKAYNPDALSPNSKQQSKHDHLLPARRSMDAGLLKHKASQDQGAHNRSMADPGLYPVSPNPKPKSISKSTDDSDIVYSDSGGAASSMAKHKLGKSGRDKSPTRSGMVTGTGRGGGGGCSMATTSKPVEASRSAIAARLVVKGLDRSNSSSSNNSSSPRPPKKRPKQARVTRQQQRGSSSSSGDGNSSCSRAPLERSPSYSAGVRVSPVINVPLYIGPGLRKGSKTVLTHFFSSKKDKGSSTCHFPSNHHHSYEEQL